VSSAPTRTAAGPGIPISRRLRSLENVPLAAVATTSRASADAAAEAFGVGAGYDDPLALITASDIDLVSVCVRVPYHRDLVLAALAAEKHVYCEWPLGRDRAEAAEMAAAAGTCKVHVAIGLQAHMNPAARRAAELIAAGAIGRPLTGRIYSSTAGFAPRLPATHAYLNKIESGANLITILGGHTLDLAILVLGGIDSLNALTTLQHPTVTLTDTGEQIQRTAPDHLLVQARMINGCALAVEVAATEHPTHRSPSKSLAPTENSSWPAVTHTASRRVDSPSASTVSINASTTRPTRCRPLRSTWRQCIARWPATSPPVNTPPPISTTPCDRPDCSMTSCSQPTVVTASHGRTGPPATLDSSRENSHRPLVVPASGALAAAGPGWVRGGGRER
jgi:predicted dehydrogenase